MWKVIPERLVKDFLNGEKGMDPEVRYLFFSHDGERSYPRLMLRFIPTEHGIETHCCLKREPGDWIERLPVVPKEVLEFVAQTSP